jgi:ABC-type molybdenum transport system ATPase subunit/photorepair protein PhrA
VAAVHAGEPVISVSGLTKRYRSVTAVCDVPFQVARAEIFGLLGRNGAGKTTTVECLQGLRQADTGDLRVLGLDPRTQAPELRRQVGCQLQESALPGRIKVWEARWSGSPRSPGQAVTGSDSSINGGWPGSGTRTSPSCPAASGSACSSRWRSSMTRKSCSLTR